MGEEWSGKTQNFIENQQKPGVKPEGDQEQILKNLSRHEFYMKTLIKLQKKFVRFLDLQEELFLITCLKKEILNRCKH